MLELLNIRSFHRNACICYFSFRVFAFSWSRSFSLGGRALRPNGCCGPHREAMTKAASTGLGQPSTPPATSRCFGIFRLRRSSFRFPVSGVQQCLDWCILLASWRRQVGSHERGVWMGGNLVRFRVFGRHSWRGICRGIFVWPTQDYHEESPVFRVLVCLCLGVWELSPR